MPNATDERTIRHYLIGNRLQTLDATIRALIEPRHAQRFFHNVVGLPSSPRGMAFRRLGPIRAPLIQTVLGSHWMLEKRDWQNLGQITALIVKRCGHQEGFCMHPSLCIDRQVAESGWQTLVRQVEVPPDAFEAVLPERSAIRYGRDEQGHNRVTGIDWAYPEAPTVVTYATSTSNAPYGDCAGCGLPVYDDYGRRWQDLHLHSGCPPPFGRCHDCQQPVRIDQQHDRQNGYLLHQGCGWTNSQPRVCTVCAVTIRPTERAERFRGSAWMHRDCAIQQRVCTVCQRSLLANEVGVQRLDRCIHARCAGQYLDEDTTLCVRCGQILREQDVSIWDGSGSRLHAICPVTT